MASWIDQVKQLQPRFRELITRYGPWALGTYFALYGIVVICAAWLAYAKFHPQSVGEFLGLLGGVWLVTRGTMIPRLLGTLLLTPLVAKLFEKRRSAG